MNGALVCERACVLGRAGDCGSAGVRMCVRVTFLSDPRMPAQFPSRRRRRAGWGRGAGCSGDHLQLHVRFEDHKACPGLARPARSRLLPRSAPPRNT